MTSRSYNCIHVHKAYQQRSVQLEIPTSSFLYHGSVGYMLCNCNYRAVAWDYLTTISVSLLYMMSQVDTSTVNCIIVCMPIIQPYEYYSTTQKSVHDVAWFSTGYKNLCTCCSLTFWQLHKLQSSHIKLFHSTGTGRTRMQLAKVVMTSALVLVACAEGLPEGKIVCWRM